MILSLNHNLTASNIARHLGSNYARLASSVERLSSGLRINRAADDATGLAVRELMRTEIAAMHQGMRNANDAISLLQTADGTLAVIDEKLIRMKELAMQAATGTYNSDQRLMIDSEFQAMASEIERIARSTQFNGIRLLDGSLSGEHNGAELAATGRLKVHFGPNNEAAEDYYYLNIGNATLAGLGLRDGDDEDAGAGKAAKTADAPANRAKVLFAAQDADDADDFDPDLDYYDPATVTYNDFVERDEETVVMPGGKLVAINKLESYFDGRKLKQGQWLVSYLDDDTLTIDCQLMCIIPKGSKNVIINMLGVSHQNTLGDNDIQLFTKAGVHLVGTPLDDVVYRAHEVNYIDNDQTNTSIDANSHLLGFTEADYDGSHLNSGPDVCDSSTLKYTTYNGMTIGYTGDPECQDDNPQNGRLEGTYDYEILTIDEVTEDLILWMPGIRAPLFKFYGDFRDVVPPAPPPKPGVAPPVGDVISISTQELAQKSLPRLDEAIIKKDAIRAHLGAMQNRLENTVSNLQIQAENLQAAESRISDTDVAAEMTAFVRSQILTQSANAMLAQANGLPRMLLELIED